MFCSDQMSSRQPSSRLSQPLPPLNQDTWRYAYQSVSGMAGRKGFDPASQGPFSEFYRLVWRPFWRQLHKVRIAHAGSFRRGSRAVDVVGCEHFCPAVRFPHLECPSLPVLLCESPVGHCPGYSNRVAWLARTMCPMYAAPPCSLLALSCRSGTFSSSSETWWTGAASRALWASGRARRQRMLSTCSSTMAAWCGASASTSTIWCVLGVDSGRAVCPEHSLQTLPALRHGLLNALVAAGRLQTRCLRLPCQPSL